MKHFTYNRVESVEEAAQVLTQEKDSCVLAGGTDLLGTMKDEILPENPSELVDIKKIPGISGIEVKDDKLIVGAATTLTEVAESEEVNKYAPALAEAAVKVATPLIRNVGTIGGNVFQDVRCWFYRYPHEVGGRLFCMRKGGENCYALQGDNRYHSIFGGMKAHYSPCTVECPALTDIPGYMTQLRQGNMEGAADIFVQYNPMPMITSRVCPHPCQDKCNQCQHGDSVNIHAVERSIGDYILEHTDRYYPAPEKETGKKVAIVGAGPGGLTAAYYLRKAGNEVVIYDNMEKAGGVLRYGIPHYRLPKHYIDSYVEAIEKMGVQFKMGVTVGRDITVEELDAQYDAMYFGTGAWKQPILGLDGENLTQFGLNFLVEVNTYLEKTIGEEILVCGGGNVAMDVALTACRLGAKKVKLVCLEQRNEMPAAEEEVLRAEEEGVEIVNGWGLGKILTDKDGKVTGLESMKCTAVRDETGRFNPQYDYDEKQVFESDYIILATGQAVDISFLGEKFMDQLKTERGLIDADAETGRTSNPKIYAGGDSVTGPNIAIRAIRTGRNSARNINADFGLEPDEWIEQEGLIRFDPQGIKIREKTPLAELPVEKRNLTDEDSSSYLAEDLAKEATRCMNCGCYAVNPSDVAPALVALGATVVTNERRISAEMVCCDKLKTSEMLLPGEIALSFEIPIQEGAVMHYDKFRLRESVDFAIASLASVLKAKDGVITDAKLVMGGVAPIPLRREKVEEFLTGREANEENAEKAAEMALEGALIMEKNEYKAVEAKNLIKNAVMRVAK